MIALAASSRAQSDKKGLTHDHHLQTQRGRAGRTRLEDIGIKTAVNRQSAGDDDHPFIVLTETKFSFRCIPVWISTLL